MFPAWELPHYPAEWGDKFDQFDEVWTATRFTDDAIRPAVNAPVQSIPNACEPHVTSPLSHAHFGIPEGRFAVLFYFDFWSYTARKNQRRWSRPSPACSPRVRPPRCSSC